VTTVRRIDPGPYLSRAVVAGDFVFLAGLTAEDRDADVAGQTAQILGKVDHYLAEAGTDKSRVVSAQIWLRDIATWSEMNKVWTGWIDKANPPARATVEAKLAHERILVEIMVTAVRS
jgi:enamine deaminase RidA (YjgF/YER057c/UK114 family)